MYGYISYLRELISMMRIDWDIPVLDVGAAQTMVHGPNFYQRFICSTNMSIGETYWWTLQRKLESQIQKNI